MPCHAGRHSLDYNSTSVSDDFRSISRFSVQDFDVLADRNLELASPPVAGPRFANRSESGTSPTMVDDCLKSIAHTRNDRNDLQPHSLRAARGGYGG